MSTNNPVSGRVAAGFLSTALSAVFMGLLVLGRSRLITLLELSTGTGPILGLWLYGYLFWLLLWAGLYISLRRRAELGSLTSWLVVLLMAVAVSAVLMLSSLGWDTLVTRGGV